jgi:Zn-finger nucleic acid-binding protein
MDNQKDRFGEAMHLVERAKENIFFAEKDRELLEKLRAQLRKIDRVETLRCLKCPGNLESYMFHGIALERCHECGGVWLDKGELEAIVRKINRGPVGEWLDKLTARNESIPR